MKPPQPGRRQAVVLCVRQLGSQALLFAPERVIAGARAAGEDRVHDVGHRQECSRRGAFLRAARRRGRPRAVAEARKNLTRGPAKARQQVVRLAQTCHWPSFDALSGPRLRSMPPASQLALENGDDTLTCIWRVTQVH